MGSKSVKDAQKKGKGKVKADTKGKGVVLSVETLRELATHTESAGESLDSILRRRMGMPSRTKDVKNKIVTLSPEVIAKLEEVAGVDSEVARIRWSAVILRVMTAEAEAATAVPTEG